MRPSSATTAASSLLALVLPVPIWAQATSDAWEGLIDGPNAVGFAVHDLKVDDDRQERGALPRSMRVFAWYPAVVGSGTPMRYRDYYLAQEDGGDPFVAERLLDDMTRPPGATEALAQEVSDWNVAARRDARPEDRATPLVIWSARDSVPHMQAALNEYLASWGYVVAFSWPRDSVPKLPWQGATPTESGRAVDVHVELMRQLVADQTQRKHVDSGQIGVLAWSYGGETAFEFARSEPRVAVAIGIDATIVSGWIFRPAALEEASVGDLAARVVLLRNGRPRIDAPDSEGVPNLLRRVPRGWSQARFALLSHGNFNVPGGLIPGLLGLEEVSLWARGGQVAVIGYQTICRATRHHLALSLEGPAASDWMAGTPDRFVEVVEAAPGRGPSH